MGFRRHPVRVDHPPHRTRRGCSALSCFRPSQATGFASITACRSVASRVRGVRCSYRIDGFESCRFDALRMRLLADGLRSPSRPRLLQAQLRIGAVMATARGSVIVGMRRGFAARARPGGRRVIGRGTKPPGGPGAWLTAGCANACCCAGGCGGGGGGRVSWRILVAWLGAGLSHAGSPGTSAAPAAWSKGRVAPVALPAFAAGGRPVPRCPRAARPRGTAGHSSGCPCREAHVRPTSQAQHAT